MRLYHGKYWHPQILVEEELATPAITQINPQQQPHHLTATLYFAHVCKTFEPVVHFGNVFSSNLCNTLLTFLRLVNLTSTTRG